MMSGTGGGPRTDRRQAPGSDVGSGPGRPPAGWLRLWGPRLAAGMVAVVYAADLVHEASMGRFPFEVLVLQFALASPVVLLLVLAAIALQQHVLLGGMTGRVQRLVFWVPRVALVTFAAFVGLFALDVFGAGYGFWETLLALVIHLAPTTVLLAAAGLAWRRPWVGAACSIGWSAWYRSRSTGGAGQPRRARLPGLQMGYN